MAISLKELMLGFIAELRTAGVRISVGESLDAMNAVAAAGVQRLQLREALRASLVKDAADDEIFDAAFARCFGGPGSSGEPRSRRDGRMGVSGGGGAGDGAASSALRPSPSLKQHPMSASPSQRATAVERQAEPQRRDDALAHSPRAHAEPPLELSPQSDESTAARIGAGATQMERGRQGPSPAASVLVRGGSDSARLRALLELPFGAYTDLQYEEARDVLAILQRRLRVRLGRRLHLARRGRIDFRRTIRAALQRGGSFVDLRFRSRRPRRLDLLILADISGSVRYASNLMLELIAGAQACFRRVTNLVFIDSLAEAEFERGHLVMTPPLDRYARSDFGRVLSQLMETRRRALNRATVLVVLGDGRNNRRPARADLLRDVRGRVRAIVWLNPEPREKWGTSDSAIAQYQRETDALIHCGNLRELEAALCRLA